MQLRTLGLALLASSVVLAACGGDDITGTANNATVQFVNATSASLDIAQGSSVATGNGALSYGTTSLCIATDATNSNLAVRQTGTSTALPGFTPAFQAGGNYSVIAYPGTAGSILFATLSNAFTATSGQGGLRVFNAAGPGTSYDIYIGTPGGSSATAVANNVGFGSGSSYFNVIAGSAQQVRITNAGSQAVALDVGSHTFIAGQNATLVIGPPLPGSPAPRAFYVTGC
ncbi:MAG: hypothetical protein DMD35_08005 [Gemmatimonadetes bacterium]|nr:MAG: hypothetical protein DMD35_08005 [Gemmatimonadota bacterium]